MARQQERIPAPDSACAEAYFRDLAEQSEASGSTLSTVTPLGAPGPVRRQRSQAPSAPLTAPAAGPEAAPGVPAASYAVVGVGTQLVAKGRQGPHAANTVQARRLACSGSMSVVSQRCRRVAGFLDKKTLHAPCNSTAARFYEGHGYEFDVQATHTRRSEQVAFVLLRLPTVASDLAMQLNTPTYVSAASAAAAHTGAGSLPTAASAPSLLLRVLRTCCIEDWGLFGAQQTSSASAQGTGPG